MARLTRKQLKKLYPLANEDYLVAMVEGKVHVVNYTVRKKLEIQNEFDKYMTRIKNVFVGYLNKKKRDYFLPEDRTMLRVWRKEVKAILKEYIAWATEVYVTSIAEVYNYKRLYNLWMISKISGAPEDDYEKPVVGESDEDKPGVVDPGFSVKKLNGMLKTPVYGSTYGERTNTALSAALDGLNAQMKGVVTGGAKDVTKYLTGLEKGLRKDVAGRIANATSLGIEGAEEFSDYDVFTANPSFGGKFQRVEVLDNKTCLVCADLDGKVYKERINRVHPNCRGVDVPIDPDTPKEAIKEMGSNKRRKESFDNWFNGLSEKEKRSLLGKTKYEKYKQGKINVHDLVKQSRVIGAKEVKELDKFKTIPSIKTDLSVARGVIDSEARKLPQRDISKITTQEELNAYFRFIDKKEGVYSGLEPSALTKQGVSRNTLKAEVSRERRILRLKETEIKLGKKLGT